MKTVLNQQPYLDSLFKELLENLLEPSISRVWLQKIVNLIKQLTNAKHIILRTFIDNSLFYASDDLTSLKGRINDTHFPNYPCDLISKPFWLDSWYICLFPIEGSLEIYWDEIPEDNKLKEYNNIFSLISIVLKNRSTLIVQERDLFSLKGLSVIERLFSHESDLKTQIALIAKEIALCLNTSRCQIKIFSNADLSTFDVFFSAEYSKNPYLEAISVIPTVELDWLTKIKNGELLLLDKNKEHLFNSISKDIESLLSIQTMVGYPLIYKKKPIGVLILHQCDYERTFRIEEIRYLKEVSLILSLMIGKELEINKKYIPDFTNLNCGVMNSDEFLRELNHIQVDAQITKSFFSLIMVDIEKLKDINFKLGFVAGNLVLSQTTRYLYRLYSDTCKIARYNNDEFVIIMKGVDQYKARIEAEKLKEELSNVSVLGIGPVDYNFSFVTYPSHSSSIPELLALLEQAMILSKSRGKLQISSFDEVCGGPNENWQQLISGALPEIILKKTSLKTGPEIIETIKRQVNDLTKHGGDIYNPDILDSVQALAVALDAKDSYTEGHSKRVSEYAYILAKQLDLDLQEIEWIRLAGAMHDIGKIGIPEDVLCKNGKLTKKEFEIMKKHPVIGAKILNPIKTLQKVANIVLYHHEYWDGSGYPNGLLKTDIPIGSRIVCIVDAYQAMTSDRPYRQRLPFEEAIKRLRAGKDKQWDPELVELFIKIVS